MFSFPKLRHSDYGSEVLLPSLMNFANKDPHQRSTLGTSWPEKVHGAGGVGSGKMHK